MANENGGSKDNPILQIERSHWGDVEIVVTKPIENTDPETITVDNMFYRSTLPAGFLYSDSENKPNQIPQLDFYFGNGTLLAEKTGASNGLVPAKFFAMELLRLRGCLLTWDGKKRGEISKKITVMIKGAKKVAMIVAHGDTYGDEGDKFWALVGSGDTAYGADRVTRSLLKKDYDLIVLFACNPDDLPLALEDGSEKRPSIIRFTVDNSFDIPEEIDQPVKFIPTIE